MAKITLKLAANCAAAGSFLPVLWLLTGLLAAVLPTGQAGAVPPAGHIPLAEIRPGMTGYGLTVFAGTKVDTFAVTVIGVQENVRVAGSLLLIEVSGHDLAKSSIAQGMSGSPIYLDGRFAGALAFGWGGSLRAIAGVTPAADMLALPSDLPLGVTRVSGSGDRQLSELIAASTGAEELAQALWPVGTRTEAGPSAPLGREWDAAGGWMSPQRLWLELAGQLAGLAPDSGDTPRQWVFQPLAPAGSPGGGSAGAPPGASADPLVPGAACAVPLVTGDVALGAIGTVTWVQGDRVLMMGHPFMQRGPVNLPLATAEILTVLPSREMSFKLGSIGAVIGAVHHDLRAGLSGRLGPAPAMVPVKVLVHDEGESAQEYRFEVVDDPLLTPTLVFWTIYNALLTGGNDASLQTVGYEVESTWSSPELLRDAPLVVQGLVAGPGGIGGLAAEVMAPLSLLLNNPYREAQLAGVTATVTRRATLQTATITGLTSPRTVAGAGEQIVFVAEIEPRQGERVRVAVPVRLPVHLPPGAYRVVAASAADLFALEAQRAAGRLQPSDLGGLVAVLKSERSASTLSVAIFAPGEATVLPGRELSNLPASVARTVRAGNVQAQRSLADYVWRLDQPAAWMLSGHAVRSLQILSPSEPVADERRP